MMETWYNPSRIKSLLNQDNYEALSDGRWPFNDGEIEEIVRGQFNPFPVAPFVRCMEVKADIDRALTELPLELRFIAIGRYSLNLSKNELERYIDRVKTKEHLAITQMAEFLGWKGR